MGRGGERSLVKTKKLRFFRISFFVCGELRAFFISGTQQVMVSFTSKSK